MQFDPELISFFNIDPPDNLDRAHGLLASCGMSKKRPGSALGALWLGYPGSRLCVMRESATFPFL